MAEIFVPWGVRDYEVHDKYPEAKEHGEGVHHGWGGRYFSIPDKPEKEKEKE